MNDPLSDERIAAAWTTGGRAPGCPPEELFWDAARGALAREEVERLLDHTASCAECALALSTAAAIHAESGLKTAPEPRASIWDMLRATILRPEAALVYLLLLAVLVPLSRLGRPDAPAVTALGQVRVVPLETESTARGAAEPAPPVSVPAEGALVLRLFLERDDLDAGVPLVVSIETEGRTVAESTYEAATLSELSGLDVAVATETLPHDVPLTLQVRSGERTVFTRRLVLRKGV